MKTIREFMRPLWIWFGGLGGGKAASFEVSVAGQNWSRTRPTRGKDRFSIWMKTSSKKDPTSLLCCTALRLEGRGEWWEWEWEKDAREIERYFTPLLYYRGCERRQGSCAKEEWGTARCKDGQIRYAVRSEVSR
ncbi:hypothetical protein LZ31DRAFT_233277 [Colletotrichum somersetense]|nr:hypothetical protein LZ31DRAFT_233277 [Colletotrichum somersetense]